MFTIWKVEKFEKKNFFLQNLLLKYVFVRTKSSSFLISYLRNLFQFSWRHPFNCCVRLKNYLCISFLTPGLSSNNFVRGFKVCASHSLSKVHIFWEGHKIYELYIFCQGIGQVYMIFIIPRKDLYKDRSNFFNTGRPQYLL